MNLSFSLILQLIFVICKCGKKHWGCHIWLQRTISRTAMVIFKLYWKYYFVGFCLFALDWWGFACLFFLFNKESMCKRHFKFSYLRCHWQIKKKKEYDSWGHNLVLEKCISFRTYFIRIEICFVPLKIKCCLFKI